MFHPGRSERECVKSYEDLKGGINKHENVAKGTTRMGKCLDNMSLAKQLRELGLRAKRAILSSAPLDKPGLMADD